MAIGDMPVAGTQAVAALLFTTCNCCTNKFPGFLYFSEWVQKKNNNRWKVFALCMHFLSILKTLSDCSKRCKFFKYFLDSLMSINCDLNINILSFVNKYKIVQLIGHLIWSINTVRSKEKVSGRLSSNFSYLMHSTPWLSFGKPMEFEFLTKGNKPAGKLCRKYITNAIAIKLSDYWVR